MCPGNSSLGGVGYLYAGLDASQRTSKAVASCAYRSRKRSSGFSMSIRSPATANLSPSSGGAGARCSVTVWTMAPLCVTNR